ncbi:unnamed protein product [Fusarium graminearum]|nr:unnamed protein product [Fusarium graminearum]
MTQDCFARFRNYDGGWTLVDPMVEGPSWPQLPDRPDGGRSPPEEPFDFLGSRKLPKKAQCE